MSNLSTDANPFLQLDYDPQFEMLGDDYYDIVSAAEFPQHILRFRNDALLPTLGLDAQQVRDDHFIEAFGKFQNRYPFLAMRYHGYQFGEYNPFLGDGRGFLYGQVRTTKGALYDFGTKGSGTTPYSRGGDGRLTLKGGIREVLAAEALHYLGVNTSRCLSLIETGESLWRGDEPSPTRSCVIVRFSRSHIRFGTFERLHYLNRGDLVQKLLNHIIAVYYPHLLGQEQSQEQIYARFYAELVQRVAELAAHWMAAGFCHAVLNTDNMSIVGESFDYGPYAFLETYKLGFTAAYFDYFGLYCYGNQPPICRKNLEHLQVPLKLVVPATELAPGLEPFDALFRKAYLQRMIQRLGFETIDPPLDGEFVTLTLQLLLDTQVAYQQFFARLRQQFSPHWRDDINAISQDLFFPNETTNLAEASTKVPRPAAGLAADEIPSAAFRIPKPQPSTRTLSPGEIPDTHPGYLWSDWRDRYHFLLNRLSLNELEAMQARLQKYNPLTALTRPTIEAVWEPIALADNWEPFYTLLDKIRTGT